MKNDELTAIEVSQLDLVIGGAGGGGGWWGAATSWVSSLFGHGTNVNVNTGNNNNIGQGVHTKGNVTIGNGNK